MSPYLLNGLQQLAISETASAQFIDRVDARYLLPKRRLEEILAEVRPHYHLFHLRGKRLFRYDTLYFDTPERIFYYQHLADKLNRYKIRSRRYVETNDQFFELKWKNNKRTTITKRVRLEDMSEQICEDGRLLLAQNIPSISAALEPALWVYYHRFMLVSPQTGERLTFDTNLWFRWQSRFVAYPNLIIADIQQERGIESPFRNLMKALEVREGGISKYCLGLANVEPSLKANNIKPMLARINRLNEE